MRPIAGLRPIGKVLESRSIEARRLEVLSQSIVYSQCLTRTFVTHVRMTEVHHGRRQSVNPSLLLHHQILPFSTSTTKLKKKKHQNNNNSSSSEDSSEATDNTPDTATSESAPDPADLTTFQTELEQVQSHLKRNLSTLGPGGRANLTTLLENLRVTVPTAADPTSTRQDRKNKPPSFGAPGRAAAAAAAATGSSHVLLGDMAQIVTRGREVHILLTTNEVGGASSVGGKGAWGKSIEAAVFKAELGLVAKAHSTPLGGAAAAAAAASGTAMADGVGAGEAPSLVYTLPIPTAESRKLEAAKAETWKKDALDHILHIRQKKQQTIKKDSKLRREPDHSRRILAKMEKMVTDASEALKKVVAQVQAKVING